MRRATLFICLFSLSGALTAAPAANSCGGCHRNEAASHPHSSMARALQTAAESEALRTRPELTFQQGPYHYVISRRVGQPWYRVTDGQSQWEGPIAWAFGLGSAGQTYLFQKDGAWHESRVSFYRDTGALDLTVGARRDVPRSLDEALGRELSKKGAEECFNCHSTNAIRDGELQTSTLQPGVQCQRCHEASEAHLAGFKSPGAAKATPPKLNSLSAEDLSNFCGQCHRTWSQIAAQGPHNVNNVRFQPYRLTNSKCFDTTDARIRCTACHDPHADVVQKASFYDSRCMACHSEKADAKARMCKVGRQDCVTCHMPKIEIREAHNRFTDHWIRIAKPSEPYPN